MQQTLAMEKDISTRPFDERDEDRGNEQFLQNVQGETTRHLDAGSLLKYYKEEAAAARAAAEEAHRKNQQDSNDNGKDDDADRSISEDIYSLIYTASVCSQAFVFALFIFLLQELLLLLILYDLVDMRHYDSSNPLQLPAGVPLTVNVAQAISMVLIVVTILCESADLTNGLLFLLDGYLPSISQKNPHATCLKWFCAGVFQCFAGSLMTIVLFILVMQSTTVISLALNFAALSFIYEIDNIAFAMGKQGFLTKKIRKACQTVTEHRIPKIAHRKRSRIVKPTLVFFMTAVLFIPYGFLVHKQWDSQFLCTRVFIQFDEVVPQLTYFTGHFDLHRQGNMFLGGFKARLDDRVYYEDATKSVRLAYCQSEEAWTISPMSGDDHCQYAYKSSSTVTFDVTKIAGSQWYGWDIGIQRVVPAPGFNLRCDDCVGGERGNCHPENGLCVNNRCECLDTRMGIHCGNEVPVCESLRVDTRTNPLPYEDGSLFSDEYEVFRSADTQNIVNIQFKPVYIMKKPWGADFMFFNGRRWEIMRPISKGKQRTLTSNIKSETQARGQQQRRLVNGDKLPKVLALGTAKSLAALFLEIEKMAQQEGNATTLLNETIVDADGNNLFRTFFFSQPVDSLSPEDKLTPAGLNWYPSSRDNGLGWAIADESRSLGTNFLCATCNLVSNTCMNEGECNVGTQRCKCNREFDGYLCEHTISCHELSCQNNGTCDAWNEYCTCDEPFYGSLCQYEDWASLEFLVEV